MGRAKRGRNLNEILADRKARRRERLRAIFFAVFVVTTGAVLFLYWQERASRPEIQPQRIVIVPLDNRTGDPGLDALSVVASDWTTRNLSYYAPGHEIVPTTSALAYMRAARLDRRDLFDRAELLANGTRAQIMAWGSFYISGDSLRFSVEVTDLKTGRMVGSIPQIAAPLDDPMRGVDRLRSAVVGAILHTESAQRPIPRRVPNLEAYQQFVTGLDAFLRDDFALAAEHFARASQNDSSYLPHQVWLIDALHRDRQFHRADSAATMLVGTRVARVDEPMAMRNIARVRGDAAETHSHTDWMAASNKADDKAAYELALSALALSRIRQARRLFSEMKPNHGYLHGKPEYYLHYAATYHLEGNHRAELNVVRSGLKVRERALDIRLANCRARAALRRLPEAQAAASAIVAPDTDTTRASVTVGAALEECAAELKAHGLNDVATETTRRAAQWYASRPRARPIVRDSIYERPYVLFDSARAAALRGDRAAALNALGDAVYNGLPVYEPGRMMLHAEPAFQTLRTTRGFLRINQPRG